MFVRVFRSLHRFQPGTFEGWLHRITTNLFLDGARRRQKIRFDGLADGSAERLPSAWPTPSEALADADLDHDVAAALAALPPEFRAAVVLCDIEGLSYEEISEVLDVKIGTVRSRIHRGRAQLRAALDHRRPTGLRHRYLGVEVEGANADAQGQTEIAESGVGGAAVRRRPCAELAESRSAYVDGALDDAGREKLLAHLVECAECRREVDDLRAVRDLLGRARSQPAPATDDLSARLVSIAGMAATEPLYTRPFRRPAARRHAADCPASGVPAERGRLRPLRPPSAPSPSSA